GRFHDAELASQAIYAGLNILSLYHNSILRHAANKYIEDSKTNLLEESQFNKYIQFWTKQSGSHKLISRLLSFITYTQVLIEMGVVKRFTQKAHYQWIAGLEAIKVVLRLTLFKLTQHRMILYPNHLERDVDPSALDPQRHRHLQTPTFNWTGRRTRKEVPYLSTTINMDNDNNMSSLLTKSNNRQTSTSTKTKYADVNDYLMSKVLTAEKLRKPQQMVHIMSSLARFGEVAFILRPLLYVLGVLKWGRKSWKPWFLSLFMDVASLLAIREGYQDNGSGRSTMLPLEKKEYNRRLRLLAFYLLKGVFYTKITRPKLERFCNRLENKPVLSIVSNVLRDYLPLWENIYFYTSTS
ncbi:peroxisome membrane protein, partial [Cunninghamella echinulata]